MQYLQHEDLFFLYRVEVSENDRKRQGQLPGSVYRGDAKTLHGL